MSGEFEAAGAMATAGLVAGAIEGEETRETGHGPCLNCGAELNGRYCANCGQAAVPHRSLVHVLHEALHSIFNIDTKAWRTLPMVIGRPGTLTRNYVYGQRARYISPLALFLLCVFLMFFAFSFVRMPFDEMNTASERTDAAEQLSEARTGLEEAQRELAAAQAHPDTDMPAGLEVRLAQQAVDLAQAEVTRREQAIERIDVVANAAQTDAEVQNATAPDAPTTGAPAAPDAPPAPAVEAEPGPPQTWQDRLRDEARSGELRVNSGWPLLNQRLLQAAENPDLSLYKVQDAASKYSFLLAPISLPFIALLFLWKRGVTLYDHVVFALYSLAFAALLFIVVLIAAETPWLNSSVPFLIGLGLPAHTFFHLKGAYALGWWSALWRTAFLLFFALFALTIFVFVIFLVGLVG